jgi:hypothetical protein
MSKKHHLHYVLVADNSGSMAGEIDEVRKELNLQIQMMKNETDESTPCTFTFRTFDSEVKNIHVNVPIENVPAITDQDYHTGGMTALFDAIGSTLSGVGELLGNRIDGENESLTMIIFSDGGENASKDYNSQQIKDLLAKYQNRPGYDIAFVGCDPASFREMENVRFSSDKQVLYSKGMESAAIRDVHMQVSDIRSKKRKNFKF